VKFWDTSALVPLLIEEPASQRLKTIVVNDPSMVVWWATQVECVSAIARAERDMPLDRKQIDAAFERLSQFVEGWDEIDPSSALRETAIRVLRVHPLRAADALHLAAAHMAADGRPASLEFVSLDDRLIAAARKEGFIVIDVAAG
jgi:hypothetical protein